MVENSESIQKIQSTTNDCLCTLKTLGVNIESWDPLLIYLVSTKLPDETLALWEQSLKSHRELPTWSQLDEFLVNRFEVVERIHSIKSTKQGNTPPTKSPEKIQTYHSQDKLDQSPCPLCDSKHSIRSCQKFREFTAQQRVDFVYANKICGNCLSSAHLKSNCRSKNKCIICHKTHHTLLHLKGKPHKDSGTITEKSETASETRPASNEVRTNISSQAEAPASSQRSCSVQANLASNNDMILLRTALIQIAHQGEHFTIRALIDPGSQRTFVSEKMLNRLQIPTSKAHFLITGIGNQEQSSEKECQLTIVSEKHGIEFEVSAIVLPKVTKRFPSVSFEISNPSELDGLDLADPYFNRSSQIDLILGNDSERFINLEGIKKNICGETSAYNTIFGWVLSGPMRTETYHSFSTNVIESEEVAISQLLRRFWEQEQVPTSHLGSESDSYCEELFERTTTRSTDGRYIVRLPFKKEFPGSIHLGSSRFLALAQFNRMGRNLSKEPDVGSQYCSVLNEYISLDHAEETSSQEISESGKFFSFYLPHHAVIRPEHRTTKLRVVFNASRKSKSGYSLNDVLHTGPALQSDLISVILNWRKYQYVFCGDIQKMYRQVLIHPQDRPYQRILIRPGINDPVRDFQLKTVTFGINCAPFLAIRTLLQLASDTEDQFPKVADILRGETYVDDILSGGFSIDEAIDAQNDLKTVLSSAGFPLKKIAANDSRLLSQVAKEDLLDSEFLQFDESSSTKTLGVKWNAMSDKFSYSLGSISPDRTTTKRKVLSAVAQLFDPAGWVAPIVIRSKVLMQQFWLEGVNWDETLSTESQNKWDALVSDLSHIDSISIPRWLQYNPTDMVEIHGFCDASQSAFCACVLASFGVFQGGPVKVRFEILGTELENM
ncbi:uncharacterized protein LOC131994782 [Stomoxys calcitrans]|uniref:uncharacterized protein LOC131994782 n=1 Tax=Stomoxys calcitrans TaxID=35570 RepID=UPI0027E2E59A|nr:uncharacterized protein LOC131994782 [Stomoxys calcitrans]